MTNLIRFTLLWVVLFSVAACQSPPLPVGTQPATPSTAHGHPTPSTVTHVPAESGPKDTSLLGMQESGGFASQFAIADQFLLALTGVPAAPDGQAYQGWLTSGDGAVLAVGQLVPAADGTLSLAWTSPTGENLPARFTGFEITLEPADGSDIPTGEAVYAGAMQDEQAAQVRLLFVTNTVEPATPLNTPFMPGILAQLDVAIQHIQNAQNAEAIAAYEEMRIHLEHVINILEGAQGERFQDYNGDGAAQNPGDGFGVKGYARRAAEVLAVPELADSIEEDVNALQDQALAILEQTDVSQVAASLAAMHVAGEALRDGPVAALSRQADRHAWFPVRSVP
ncbi:MAG: anti-sigma factor [Chloroflexota bacterium]